ncbi:putative oxalate/formate antiporter [Nitritalea halalkaliphila LW7]|uniref:Putative oxalate/formate antiporter n=1 Tax=Nitritalea halalkaliphila LW7 TaxID=1189621 RepID=I5C3T8_9BACT|nr:OFA family MFS transporter [Nitritalea halalkaliphila]EIM76490.1 putative oxalate/formate antiporter [Nitritalea halalkaliphila LW7]
MGFLSFLDREKSIAKPGYSRWLVPPAALAIHLCIGQIYAYSVFNEPMTRIVGIDAPADGDWQLTTLGWIFSIALFTLGASAALFGKWLEKAGPRKAMFVAALCFAGGFLIASFGVSIHNIWLVYLGHGVLGGIGLGLGYISPVSTLIKWFPDRPGLATGMAIMGFGGGAMVASPLSVSLMDFFASSTSTGVAETFLTMGLIYFVFMMFGVFMVRVPAKDWKPENYTPPASTNKMITKNNVEADVAIKTPQFYFLFVVLMLNVTAGIGVLGQASVMIQELFSADSVGDKAIGAAAAAGFVGLLSLFNMGGRFFWSSISDKIGRKNTYSIFFLLGAVLYFVIPSLGNLGSAVPFIIAFCIIISMYGGGFATIPAYLRDMFGTFEVGAIHGRLLLAWSLAAVFGPSLINYLRAYQIETVGLPAAQAYSFTMYIMAGLLVIGMIANLLVKPVDAKYHMKEKDATASSTPKLQTAKS